MKIHRPHQKITSFSIMIFSILLGACGAGGQITPSPSLPLPTPLLTASPVQPATPEPELAQTPITASTPDCRLEDATPESENQPDSVVPELPEYLPVLPSLSTLLENVRMGSVQAPAGVEFILNAPLQAGSEKMPVYIQMPHKLTAYQALEMAADWGMEPGIYTLGEGVEAGDSVDFTRRVFVAVDEPVWLTWEGAEYGAFWDRSVFPDTGGRWAPPDNLPPVDQAIRIVHQFLDARPMLMHPYKLNTGGYERLGVVRFCQTLDSGYLIWPPFVEATISAEGEMGRLVYRSFDLEPLGEVAIITAQQAWEMINQEKTGDRLWFEVEANSWTAPPADPREMNPRFWMRTYTDGQQADLFGALRILYPTSPGDAPHILMNNLALSSGDMPALAKAYQQRVESTGDIETPVHVWGVVENFGEVSLLQVEGWESDFSSPSFWSGVIQTEGASFVLAADDGSRILLPDLPAGLGVGTEVFVNGGLWEGLLEWSSIQEFVMAVAPPPAAIDAGVQARIEQVELIYFAAPLESLPLDCYADFSCRSVQPVWRFSGQTTQGAAFNIFVQAAAGS